MKTVQEYLRHAEECEALLHKKMTDEERQAIRHMAETWRMLAERRKKAIEAGKASR